MEERTIELLKLMDESLQTLEKTGDNVLNSQKRLSEVYDQWSKKMGNFIFWLKMMIAALLLVALTHVTIYLLQRHDLKAAQQQVENAKNELRK